MSQRKILLVEGESDRGFYEALSKRLMIELDEVKICTPKSVGEKNSKQGVLHALPTYLQQLADGTIERLAVVVDADSYETGGLGFLKTLSQLIDVLAPYKFVRDSAVSPGLIFNHSDGLNSFGAWIMPDNLNDGMLEDWIKSSIHPDEMLLMTHAQASIKTIPAAPKFKPMHLIKAEVATWLAWQTKPEHGLYKAAEEDGLLNVKAQLFLNFHIWLDRVFPGT